jgi:ATP-dependent Clp protease adaptor protein ClpS
MEQEKYSYNEDVLELLENERTLLLMNDDVNTFDYVIEVLMKVCHHTLEQAETCAMITHYKGKCSVKSGTYEELEPYYISLLNHHLYAKIQ